MKKILKIVGISLGVLVTAAVIGSIALYVATDGEYIVLATVSDDPDLPSAEINGHTFHVQTFGDDKNPVIIVLHGGPGVDYRSLLELQQLADDYFVVFYDQLGSGLSERVPIEELSYQGALDDLDAFIDHYGKGEQVVLIGHSWGAMLASGYLSYTPEKVSRSILAEPGFLNAAEQKEWQAYFSEMIMGPEYVWLALKAGFTAMHVDGPDEYAREDFLVGKNILPYFLNHPNNPYHCPGEAYDAPSWRFGNSVSKAIQGAATEETLDTLSAKAGDYKNPVLFMAGECDTWIGAELQAKHAELYPDAQLVVIPDSGHEVFWDNPEASIKAVREFLSQ